MVAVVLDVSFIDAWEEGKHPRGQPENAGEFAAASSGVPKVNASYKRVTKHNLLEQEEHARARELGKAPAQGSVADLYRALKHLRPAEQNKIDRQARAAILAELIKRGESIKKGLVQRSEVFQEIAAQVKKDQGEGLFPKKEKESTQWAAAFKGKVKGERVQHEKAWSPGNQLMLQVVANTKPLSRVNISNASAAYYSQGEHSVTLGGYLTSVLIWRHEYGHVIDYNGKGIPWSASQNALLQEEGVALDGVVFQKIDHELRERDMQLLSAPRLMDKISLSWHKPRVYLIFSPRVYFNDFVAGLTNSRLGFGHSKAYFAKPNYREAECFANYVCLTQGPDGDYYRKQLQKAAPKLCAVFQTRLERIAEGKSNA